MWAIRVLPEAARDLEKLSIPVGRRIVKRLRWLAESFDAIQPQPLKGDLAGFYKLRAGDDRIIYQVLRNEKNIIIHAIGHRSRIYRER